MSYMVQSTGVLRREPQTLSAVINLVNLGFKSQFVVVEVWDWSSYSNPVQLPVLIGNNEPVQFPYALAPNNLAVMYADLTDVLFYEVRIFVPKHQNIIVNTFGRNALLAAQEGNTVLNSQLVRINPSTQGPSNGCCNF